MSRLTSRALTLAEYKALDKAGLITRPLTDPPIGADPTRRELDAQTSAIHTEPDNTLPTFDRKDTAA